MTLPRLAALLALARVASYNQRHENRRYEALFDCGAPLPRGAAASGAVPLPKGARRRRAPIIFVCGEDAASECLRRDGMTENRGRRAPVRLLPAALRPLRAASRHLVGFWRSVRLPARCGVHERLLMQFEQKRPGSGQTTAHVRGGAGRRRLALRGLPRRRPRLRDLLRRGRRAPDVRGGVGSFCALFRTGVARRASRGGPSLRRLEHPRIHRNATCVYAGRPSAGPAARLSEAVPAGA